MIEEDQGSRIKEGSQMTMTQIQIDAALQRIQEDAKCRTAMHEKYWQERGAYCEVYVSWDEHNVPTMAGYAHIQYVR
jgi:hypothetical protein